MALRAHSIRETIDPGSGESLGIDRDEVDSYLEDAAAALFRFGGMLQVAVERVDTGERVGGQPIMATRAFHFFYETSAPLAGTEAPAPEPEPAAAPEQAPDTGE